MLTRTEKITILCAFLGTGFLSGTVGWAKWSLQTYVSVQIEAQAKYNAEHYCTKADCDKSGEVVAALKTEVAVIKSEMSGTIRMKP